MNTMEIETLNERLEDVRGKLGRTISQIKLIDIKLRDLNQRYKRASTNKKNSFRYHLRMRMSITAGVKLMYMQYLTAKAEQVRAMEQALEGLMNRMEANSGARPQQPPTAPVEPSHPAPFQGIQQSTRAPQQMARSLASGGGQLANQAPRQTHHEHFNS